MKWRKKVKNQQLSIGKRWKIDAEYYEKNGNVLSISICESCIYNMVKRDINNPSIILIIMFRITFYSFLPFDFKLYYV